MVRVPVWSMINLMQQPVNDLEDLLGRLKEAANTDHRQITVAEVLHEVGSRSFSPLLLLIGVSITSPLSGIPGMPTVASALLLLISGQLLIGRRHFWLPSWLLRRSVARDRLLKSIDWLLPSARIADRCVKPRMTALSHGRGGHAIAVVCLAIACLMPLLELIPFSSSVAGVALLLFGLALVADDGLLALLGYAMVAALAAIILFGVL